MNWLEKFRHRLGYDDPGLDPPDENESLEANTILMKAKSAIVEAQHHTEEVNTVVSSLADLRARNHFGESIHLAMMPKEKNK